MDRDLIKKIEDKIHFLQKRLEMVLKTSRDGAQRKRVSQQLAVLKKDFIRLQNGAFPEAEINKYIDKSEMAGRSDSGEEVRELEDFPLLREIELELASPLCREQEINEIHTFLKYFEDEFWAGISDYQLKLEFNAGHKREAILNELNMLRITIKNYLDILSDLDRGAASSEYENKLRSMKTKQHMDVLMKTGDFIIGLHDFIGYLLEDYRNGGNIILNPDDSLNYDSLHGEKSMEGMNIVAVIEKLHAFLGEFREYLNIPDMKKNAESGFPFSGE